MIDNFSRIIIADNVSIHYNNPTTARIDGWSPKLKQLIRYAHEQVKEISVFEFEDHLKIGKVPLSYFYIIYTGMSWPEKHFNGKLKNYTDYHSRLTFLKDPSQKPEFINFLEIAQPPSIELVYRLKPFYMFSKTYKEFFDAIPMKDRFDLLNSWLKTFMDHYLKNVNGYVTWFLEYSSDSPIEDEVVNLFPSKYPIVYEKEMQCF